MTDYLYRVRIAGYPNGALEIDHHPDYEGGWRQSRVGLRRVGNRKATTRRSSAPHSSCGR